MIIVWFNGVMIVLCDVFKCGFWGEKCLKIFEGKIEI